MQSKYIFGFQILKYLRNLLLNIIYLGNHFCRFSGLTKKGRQKRPLTIKDDFDSKNLNRINRNPTKHNHEFAPITSEFARIKMSLGVKIREICLIRENSWFNFIECNYCPTCALLHASGHRFSSISFQARIPPTIFFTLRKPLSIKIWLALWLRPPLRQ